MMGPVSIARGESLNQHANKSKQVDGLRARVASLEDTLRELDRQRELEIRRRRRNLLLTGITVSLLAHLALMLYLNRIYRVQPASAGVQPVSVEFAVIQDTQLTQLEELQFEDLVPEVAMDVQDPASDPSLELDAEVSAADLDIAPTGAVPTLAGSGGAEGSTLGGGGAGTTFFGVSSRGTRFAYIVDVSGSMGQYQKLDVCMRELARSIEMLPDYAYFYVVLYSTDYVLPPVQRGWTRARGTAVSRVIRWLNRVGPSGGTKPQPAFQHVFSLEVRPDVIFFLTDGLIPPGTADAVQMLNSRGRQVVVNTIAFGDPTSQDLLRQIARQSGGVYRYVPSNDF